MIAFLGLIFYLIATCNAVCIQKAQAVGVVANTLPITNMDEIEALNDGASISKIITCTNSKNNLTGIAFILETESGLQLELDAIGKTAENCQKIKLSTQIEEIQASYDEGTGSVNGVSYKIDGKTEIYGKLPAES